MYIYEGIFIDNFYDNISPTLERSIDRPHITTAFKPKQFHTEWIGEEVEIICTGYGIDKDNEGFSVNLKARNPALQQIIDAIEKPHITISVSKIGKPVNTKQLTFKQINQIKFIGHFNIYET